MHNLERKTQYSEKFKGKIKISIAYNLLRRKFAVVCRNSISKLQISARLLF